MPCGIICDYECSNLPPEIECRYVINHVAHTTFLDRSELNYAPTHSTYFDEIDGKLSEQIDALTYDLSLDIIPF